MSFLHFMHKHLQKSDEFFLLQLELKLIKKTRRPYNLHTQVHGPGLATTTRHIVLDKTKSTFDRMLIERVRYAEQIRVRFKKKKEKLNKC